MATTASVYDELRDLVTVALCNPGILMSVPGTAERNGAVVEMQRHINDVIDEALHCADFTPFIVQLTSGQITLDEFRSVIAERYAMKHHEKLLNARKNRLHAELQYAQIPCRNHN